MNELLHSLGIQINLDQLLGSGALLAIAGIVGRNFWRYARRDATRFAWRAVRKSPIYKALRRLVWATWPYLIFFAILAIKNPRLVIPAVIVIVPASMLAQAIRFSLAAYLVMLAIIAPISEHFLPGSAQIVLIAGLLRIVTPLVLVGSR